MFQGVIDTVTFLYAASEISRDVAALGLAEMNVVEGGEAAKQLARGALQCPRLYPMAEQARPRPDAGYHFVAGP